MKDVDVSESASLFEFTEPEGARRWVATPGRQTTFPLVIRNETSEGQDVAVIVEEPANWVWAEPHRISLDPGNSAAVSIVFSPQRETMIAAGAHQAAIRIRDLEGVIFAECVKPFEVEELQEVAMTLSLRGPLMSFGMAEGFVLHCTLSNRGNVDVAVTPVGDPHPTLTFSKRTVSVPFQGEVSFDIEVRWNPGGRRQHPDQVTLRAPFRDGSASASIDWRTIAEALDPFMPIYSTSDDDDELLSLSWLPQPGEDVLEHKLPDIPAEAANGAAALVVAPSSASAAVEPVDAPVDAPVAGPPPAAIAATRRAVASAPAKRINPWWPMVQYIGGKWRVKPLPFLMLIIGVEGFFLGMTQAQRDYYASPELRSPVPVIGRAFTASSHAASSAVAMIERRLHIGHAAKAAAPKTRSTIWGLAAHYKNAHTLAVSFHQTGCKNVMLVAASGTKIVYRHHLKGTTASVHVPSGLSAPVRLTVSGQAHNGAQVRQHLTVPLPFALRRLP